MVLQNYKKLNPRTKAIWQQSRPYTQYFQTSFTTHDVDLQTKSHIQSSSTAPPFIRIMLKVLRTLWLALNISDKGTQIPEKKITD
jgi:hypothetical protein